MKKFIKKKDETIKYDIDYIKKNLELNKFLDLLEKECFAAWYFDSAVYLEDHERNNIFDYFLHLFDYF